MIEQVKSKNSVIATKGYSYPPKPNAGFLLNFTGCLGTYYIVYL